MHDVLAEACENSASWRRLKADDYPDDPRNSKWADNLGRMAGWARRLPNDDERLQRLESLCAVAVTTVSDGSGAVLSFGVQASKALSRCAADDDAGFDALLDDLVSLAEEDAIELARMGGVWVEKEEDEA